MDWWERVPPQRAENSELRFIEWTQHTTAREVNGDTRRSGADRPLEWSELIPSIILESRSVALTGLQVRPPVIGVLSMGLGKRVKNPDNDLRKSISTVEGCKMRQWHLV